MDTNTYNNLPEAHKHIADMIQMTGHYLDNPKDFPVDADHSYLVGKHDAYKDAAEALEADGVDIDFKKYQELAMLTSKMTTKEDQRSYGMMNTISEVGEVAGKFAKATRDNGGEYDTKEVAKEIGDVLWSLACLCEGMDLNLQDIAEENLMKVKDRWDRGQIGGSGDNR